MLGNLNSRTLATFTWEPLLGNVVGTCTMSLWQLWEPCRKLCLGTLQEPSPWKPWQPWQPWEPSLGNLYSGTLLGNLYFGNFGASYLATWEPLLGNLLGPSGICTWEPWGSSLGSFYSELLWEPAQCNFGNFGSPVETFTWEPCGNLYHGNLGHLVRTCTRQPLLGNLSSEF